MLIRAVSREVCNRETSPSLVIPPLLETFLIRIRSSSWFSTVNRDVTKRQRRVESDFALLVEKVSSMAGRPHKGDRVLLQTRPHPEVARLVETRQRDAGVSSLSQYIADVLALHVGRRELSVELGSCEQPLIEHIPAVQASACAVERPLLQTRPFRVVWEDIHRMQFEAGVSSVSRYTADVLARHVGRPDLILEFMRDKSLPQQEELPLAM